MWVLNSISIDEADLYHALLEIPTYTKKATFKTFNHSGDLGITLLNIPQYKEIPEQAISIFVQMSTSYLCKQGFSFIVLIKTKNANLNLDAFTRCSLEHRLTLRIKLIANKIHHQPSH